MIQMSMRHYLVNLTSVKIHKPRGGHGEGAATWPRRCTAASCELARGKRKQSSCSSKSGVLKKKKKKKKDLLFLCFGIN